MFETMSLLPREFYSPDPLSVARSLLGKSLVRYWQGQRLAGLIAEVEAYGNSDDPASHAYRQTPRSATMFGTPGTAYVYFVYGMHHCMNVVCSPDGIGGAVLIRAVLPTEGLDVLVSEGLKRDQWTRINGPARVCRAFHIDRTLNGTDLCDGSVLGVNQAAAVPDQDVLATPRIGVGGDSEAKDRPWRLVWTPST
jgi:DNA-3-methyladenine glycosylase